MLQLLAAMIISHDFNFQFQAHAKFPSNPLLGEVNQSKDISGPCLTPVDNEIGVLWGDLGISNADTLQPDCLYESAGKIPGRILEH